MANYNKDGESTKMHLKYGHDGTDKNGPLYDIDGKLIEYASLEETANSYYYDNDLLQKFIYNVNNRLAGIKNKVAYLFVTDIHLDLNSFQSPFVIKQILDNVPLSACIFGGDVLRNRKSGSTKEAALATIEQYKELFVNYIGKERWYPIRGNHDFWQYTVSSSASNANVGWTESDDFCYDNLFAHLVDNNKVNITPKHCYYWFDIDNTRFIVIDDQKATKSNDTARTQSLTVDNTQQQWCADVLKNSNDKNIVICCHHRPIETELVNSGIIAMLKAFKTRGSYTINDTVNNFSSCNGNIIYWLAGHDHGDFCTTGNTFRYRQTESDAPFHIGAATIDERNQNDPREIAFDIDIIDYDKNKVYMLRFGFKNESTSFTSERSFDI